jgi:hypothetical protein
MRIVFDGKRVRRNYMLWTNRRREVSSVLKTLVILVISAVASLGAQAQSARTKVIPIVTKIQRADYEGDRAALKTLYGELTPYIADKEIASRVRYWRGFAMWRRSINGFNDAADPKELEADLNTAVEEFNDSAAKDPAFTDAKIALISCLGYLMYMNQKNPARIQELLDQSIPLSRAARAEDPENPRLLWVLGPVIWNTPAERGGGQDKAIENYLKGIEFARKRAGISKDALDPQWGEPELLMNLAWSNLNRATPDSDAAEKYARAALQLVPYWHYVRDILLAQIKAAKTKS